MNILKNALSDLKRPSGIIFVVVVIVCVALTALSYRFVGQSPVHADTPIATDKISTPTLTMTSTPIANASPTPVPIVLPVQDPTKILGVDAGDINTQYKDIPWLRLGYPTCGWGNLRGALLRNTIQAYHSKGIRILLTVCQPSSVSLFDANLLNDVAQGNSDAVQCGNEEMKQDAAVSFLYVPPEKFARFYDLCEHAVHSVRSDVPVLLGSLDPHVAGPDYQLMVNQANYLDQMQNAMNTSVHPGGNWDWHNQTLGLIDSWHNGYMGANNLDGTFSFWAQQFHLDVNSGTLGKHLWVVEGTGCFRGCGVNADSPYDVAVSHVLALVTDVQTAQRYHVPFFYFSGKDFQDQGINWPIGILDQGGHPKPIRQDLAMGARTLSLSCAGKATSVADQEQLLARMYRGCSLPSNYVGIITS
jgi:hypothetical protein